MMDVPDRDGVMVHPANHLSEIEGCIATGRSLVASNGEWATAKSRDAYKTFLYWLYGEREWNLRIRNADDRN